MRRGLAVALLSIATFLVLGRAFAFLYAESAWYAAVGAGDIWTERVADTLIIHLVTLVGATGFALANFSAVRHSILSLVLPRRLGNVEFAEAVPTRRLDFAAVVMAIVVGIIAATAAPSWTSLALVRTGVRFRELDPYHQLDLGFYTTWLPFELQLHRWAWVVVLLTTLIVVILYALTPGLRWEGGMVRMTGYVRRHLSTLVAVILLMLAWRARLSTYTILFDGSGVNGAFTAADHRWLLPATVILGIATIAGAALFLWGAWSRQNAISFFALTAVLVLWVGIRYVLPLLVRYPAPTTSAAIAADAPYAETRAAFTRRAFELDETRRPVERQHAGAELDRSADVVRLTSMAHVAPGAAGHLVVSGETGRASPELRSTASRLAHAWEERDGSLLSRDLPPRPAILRVRDVSQRVGRIAPVFVQGTRPAAVFRADTLYWLVELYSSSPTYPLSQRFTIAGERRGYFRHAATAYVQGSTGATTLVLDSRADPIAVAWQRRFPRVVRSGVVPAWTEELALEPTLPVPPAGEADSLFRARVRQLYLRMRAALSGSDLVTFGAWFDSLGALLRRPPGDDR